MARIGLLNGARPAAAFRLERDAFVLSQLQDAIVVTDLAGVVTYWNSGAEQLFGWSAEEMIGQPYASRFPEAIRGWICAEIASRSEGVDWDGEFHDYRKDGTRVWIDARVRRITGEAGEPVAIVGISHDITERKRLEEQLRQSQKLEAVGRFAGGVAHDFNNLLMVINGYTGLLRDVVHDRPSACEMLDAMDDASGRVALLTQQLLACSRTQILQPEVINLSEFLNESRGMIERLIGEDIQLAMAVPPAVDPVLVDRGQATLVLLNLCLNARDAMPAGGTLRLDLANASGEEIAVDRHALPLKGRYVALSVSDTGCGMDADTQRHLFEPFFTTKPRDQGAGLGLATVYGIVTQSGGFIRSESAVGLGSRFFVYLPVTDRQPERRRRVTERRGGHETVLLAEDEPGVRTLTRRMLERAGYTVLVAKNGEDAVDLATGHRAHIDLLLTDVVMPRMSGRQVADAVLRAHPETRVLYMSGYTDDAVVRRGVSRHETAFLQKPFGTGDLLARLREVLDRPTSSD